ncbi:MAG: hypothetical protein J6J36_06625 [Clostridia bacterium]|nr:hypothetical protein [Clostridia bacterium]
MSLEELRDSSDLHSIVKFISQKNDIRVDSQEWQVEYERLIALLYAVGKLTEQSVDSIIARLDRIDSEFGVY